MDEEFADAAEAEIAMVVFDVAADAAHVGHDGLSRRLHQLQHLSAVLSRDVVLDGNPAVHMSAKALHVLDGGPVGEGLVGLEAIFADDVRG